MVTPPARPGSFFESLDEASRERLLAQGQVRRYPARSILFLEGDPAHDVLVVRKGDIKVSANVDGHDVVLDIVGPDDLLGEIAVVDGHGRSATATTLNPVEVVRIPAASFLAHLEGEPTVMVLLLRSMSSRLRDASRRQVEYGALDAVGRVCRRLVELAERFGQPAAGGGVVIDGPLTQGEIAAWAGISREAVVKALSTMRRLGWVTTTARAITVVDLVAVTARAVLTPE